jgi:hypothetical protein
MEMLGSFPWLPKWRLRADMCRLRVTYVRAEIWSFSKSSRDGSETSHNCVEMPWRFRNDKGTLPILLLIAPLWTHFQYLPDRVLAHFLHQHG